MLSPRIAGAALLLAGGMLQAAFADTDIRDRDGKRVLFVDRDGSLRPEPGGKRLLFIDGDDLRTEPGGKRLLFVDGDDVRPEPGGIRLAFIDGDHLRRGPGGKVLMHYKHPDISPNFGENRIYLVDGDALSKPQLIAVLYHLKPDLFKLSADEEADLKKSMKEAGEAEEKRLAADRAPGKFEILTADGADKISSGFIEVSPKRGDAYLVKFKHKDGPEWEGVAIQREEPPKSGDRWLWVAFGTPKSIALAVFEIKGGTLEGKWYPPAFDGEAKNMGTETMKGPEGLNGEYTTTGKSPVTQADYAGKVTIKPADIGGASDNCKPYNVTWDLGGTKIVGMGIKVHNFLIVSAAGPDTNIASFKLDTDGTMIGDWFNTKGVKGYYTTMKSNN